MATITTVASPAGAPGQFVRGMDNNTTPRRVFAIVDFAAATTAKGTALVATDIIEALTLQAGTAILAAGLRVVTPVTTSATDLTVHIGTAVDNDQWVVSFDLDAATTSGAVAPYSATEGVRVLTAQDTIDLTIATMTGTLTAGKVEVWAVVSEPSTKARGNIAALKS